MPVQSPHPLYEAYIDKWQRCRDAYDGEDAVKEAGTKYLPKIDPTQSNADYESYKKRASYYEAIGRTVDGFVGAISRKPHTIEVPAQLKPLLDDATTDGTSLDDLIKKLCMETLLIGRGGVLVDYDDASGRAYLAIYGAESILNWDDNRVVISETVYVTDPDDPLKQIAAQQIRECKIEDGRYSVTLWRKQATQGVMGEWQPAETITPTFRGAPLAEMPWFWLTAMGRSSRIEKPALLGLVNTSMSHYRTSADLEHGRHFTALPTLYIVGAAQGDPIAVGGGAVISISNPQGKVGYAEFTGQGLGSLENAIESKEHQMATLGAAIWGGRKGIEAAETARIRTAGENSLLMSIVSAVEVVLTAAIEFAAQWMGVTGPIEIKLNRDFIDQKIDAQTLAGMVQAYQAGAMSLESFLYCLQQSEMLPPDTEIEDEVVALNAKQAAKTAAAAKVAAQIAKSAGPADPQNPGGDEQK